MRKKEKVFALLTGVGISLLITLGGALLAVVYIVLSAKETYYLSSYFAVVLFVSVFCGGYAAGLKGGVGNWMPAGLIGAFTGGMLLLLLYILVPLAPGVGELLKLLLLPALFSCSGALISANRVRRQRPLPQNSLNIR